MTARRQDLPGEPIEVRASDGARLAGRWLPAPGPALTGRTALLLHGFAEATSALEARRAAALNRHGWNVAVLDSRGYGQSAGPYPTFGGHEAGDIRAWLDLLSQRIAGSTRRFRFIQCSGAARWGQPSPLRTAAAEHGLAAMVLESPMVDLVVSMACVLRRGRIPFPSSWPGLSLVAPASSRACRFTPRGPSTRPEQSPVPR